MLIPWLAGGHVNSEVSMLSDGACPVAVRAGIALEEMGDDLLIFDTRSQQAHSLNAAGGAVWQACDGRHTPAALAQRLGFDEDAVRLALRSLSDCELLEAPVLAEGFVSRRALLRRLVFAGAGVAAVPIIRSVAVPSAAHAASLCTAGSCGTNFFRNSLQACQPGRGRYLSDGCNVANGECSFPLRCVSNGSPVSSRESTCQRP